MAAQKMNTRELTVAIDNVLSKNAKLSSPSRPLVARMYETFRNKIGPELASGAFNVTFWTDVIGDMMALAKTFNVPGMEKKEILLEVIYLVIDSEVPEDKREALRTAMSTVISPAIDLAIQFSHKIVTPKCLSKCC